MSREVSAILLPLFDRLAGTDPQAIDGVLLDGAGLQKSLARDLSRLFNTRNGCTIDRFLQAELSVIDYGLPDVTALWPASKNDRDTLAEVIKTALSVFEPRFRHVLVTVREHPGSPSSVKIGLAAVVELNRQARRVEFDMAVDARTGTAEVDAP